MDDLELRKLIEGSPEHWTDDAQCVGDSRFTGRREDLTLTDRREMRVKCGACPVWEQCHQWASSPDVHDVFAAGFWRFPENGDELY